MIAGKDFIGVGCGAIVINNKNEILLVKRSLNSRTEPGSWSRPGGEVNFYENLEEATKREVKEETGINVKIIRFLELSQNIDIKIRKHWIAIGFLAKYVSGVAKNLEPEKHDDVKWFPLSKLPDNLNSYTRKAIKVYLNSRK